MNRTLVLAACGKRGLTLHDFTIFLDHSMISKGSDPFFHRLLEIAKLFLNQYAWRFKPQSRCVSARWLRTLFVACHAAMQSKRLAFRTEAASQVDDRLQAHRRSKMGLSMLHGGWQKHCDAGCLEGQLLDQLLQRFADEGSAENVGEAGRKLASRAIASFSLDG